MCDCDNRYLSLHHLVFFFLVLFLSIYNMTTWIQYLKDDVYTRFLTQVGRRRDKCRKIRSYEKLIVDCLSCNQSKYN